MRQARQMIDQNNPEQQREMRNQENQELRAVLRATLALDLEIQNPAWFASDSESGAELTDDGMQPADERFIQPLPIHIIVAGNAIVKGECPICRRSYQAGEEHCRLPCFHAFHRACVSAWLMYNSTCPCCRHRVQTASCGSLAKQ